MISLSEFRKESRENKESSFELKTSRSSESSSSASSSTSLDGSSITSSSSSSSQVSSTSSASSIVASSPASVRVVGRAILKQTIQKSSIGPSYSAMRKEKAKEATNRSGHSNNASAVAVGAPTTNQQGHHVITSSESVKRYKNSPFGLNHHYLTMPDALNDATINQFNQTNKRINSRLSVSREKKKKKKKSSNGTINDNYNDEESEDIDGIGVAADTPPIAESSNQEESFHDLTNTSNACDLSVLASSNPGSASNSAPNSPALNRHQLPPWSETAHHYKSANHHRQVGSSSLVHHKQLHVDPIVGINHHNHQHQNSNAHANHSHTNYLMAASDVGLDAKKCNAKEPDCFYEPDNADDHDHHNHHHGHREPIDLKAQKIKLGSEWSQATDSSGLLVKFSSIMYATFLVILGCILHVSELRQKSKNSSDHIYTITVAMIGIIWLLYLQTDLQRYKKYASKYILIETIFNDHRQKRQELENSNNSSTPNDPTARSTTSSSASLVNDRMSMNTEVIFKKTAYKMYQQRAALEAQHLRQNPLNHKGLGAGIHKLLHHNQLRGASFGDPYVKSSTSSRSSSSFAKDPQMLEVGDGSNQLDEDCSQHLVPAYKFLHGKMGANFYLKCGMAAFCFGHVIHEGLRFGQQVYFFSTGNLHCRDSAALVAHLVTPLYSFYQLFMMFKYSNLVINRHKILARFGLMHIIGTSVTFWIRTILEEAFEDFVHKMDYFKSNKPQMNSSIIKQRDEDSNLASLLASISNVLRTEASERSDWSISNLDTNISDHNMTRANSLLTLMSSPISATITPQMVRHLPDSYACAQNTLLTTKSMNALPYLYPFTIEYNLLLAATFLSLYFNIGKIGLSHCEASCKPFLLANSRNYFQNNQQILTKARDGLESSSSSSPVSHVGLNDNSSAIRERNEKEFGEYKSNFVVNADCHSANKGLFCGFFVLLVTLVTIVIFFVTINKPTHIQLGIKINLIQEATLTALILIVTLAGFKQVVKLNRNPYLKDKVTTDDVLMLIPLPFFFIHSLLSFRAETASISSGSISYFSSILHGQGNHQHQNSHPNTNGNLQSILFSANNNNTKLENRSRLNNLLASHPNGTNGRFVEDFISNDNSSNNSNGNNSSSSSRNSNRNGRNISNVDVSSSSSQIDHFKLITVALNIIVMIEVLVQTNFIIDGMRRCSESRYLRFKKPGRELITFAILLNITYWIVATFETKSVEQYKTEIEYYGPLPYMFISHTTLPVMLFYRYHSSVCLAEIWNHAYKPPKKQ